VSYNQAPGLDVGAPPLERVGAETEVETREFRMVETLITLFLCGDVMTGRGIDQALPRPGNPALHERFVRDARRYLRLAEEASGPIDTPLEFDTIWGDGLDALARASPDVRIINLETAVTTSDDAWQGKSIHYRMHPQNVSCLTAAGVDICSLANNHALDWGYPGLIETLETLSESGLKPVGAGRDRAAASAPAIAPLDGDRRVLVFACATLDSGVPFSWLATPDRAGINVLPTLGEEAADRIGAEIRRRAGPDDVVVVSIHWGGNWGYEISEAQVDFAHRLIDEFGVDVVHGHSSHHVKGLEVYSDRLILYGCGDLITDYEGIGGHEEYRPELSLMYFPALDETGRLRKLTMAPMRIRRFRLNHASDEERAWLRDVLNRESERFGVQVIDGEGGALLAQWETPRAEGAAPDEDGAGAPPDSRR